MKQLLRYVFPIALIILAHPHLVAQELPLVIQGVLKSSEGTALPDGSYPMTFRLYLSNDGDAVPIWTETQPDIQLRDGVYSVALGRVNPLVLPFDNPYFLGVSLADGSEFIPRSELTAAPSALFASRAGGGVEPGMIAPFAGYFDKIPPGWIPCDGRALKSSDYPGLFEIIGTIYGNGSSGVGSGGGTNFNLPDLNGQFLRGLHEGRFGINRELGSKEGFATGGPRNPIVATTNSAGTHSHSFGSYIADGYDINSIGGTSGAATFHALVQASASAGAHTHPIIVTGGDIETRPRNRAMIYCIKY